MAQIKIVNFDLIPSNNIFFKESRKLKVDFELILVQSETERNIDLEIEFSISSLSNRGRTMRAIAGKKRMDINSVVVKNDIIKSYTLDENGKMHYLLNFISEDIPEQLLIEKKSEYVCTNLFITAELHNPLLQVLLGFAESAGKEFMMNMDIA